MSNEELGPGMVAEQSGLVLGNSQLNSQGCSNHLNVTLPSFHVRLWGCEEPYELVVDGA